MRRAHSCRLNDERGIALVVAVLALVVIGALVAGTFFAGRLEQRGGLNSLFAGQAFEAAEAGAATTIASWDVATFNALPVGGDTTLAPAGSLLGGNVSYVVTVNRLTAATFLVRSEGARVDAAGGVLARRLVGVLARLDAPALDVQGALTAGGAVDLGSAADVDGTDVAPPGWAPSCPAGGAAVSPVRSNSAVQVDSGPVPPVLSDTALGGTTFTSFGSTTFDAMAAGAGVTAAGTVTPLPAALPAGAGGAATCSIAAAGNWGEPDAGAGSTPACVGYLPVIYAPGDLHFAGGRGQGMLLVRGDLVIAGGARFYGPVVVLGRVTAGPGGGQVFGALLVAGKAAGQSQLAGIGVGYSSCAVARALLGSAPARPFAERSWSLLY